jgi:hypothetical protein
VSRVYQIAAGHSQHAHKLVFNEYKGQHEYRDTHVVNGIDVPVCGDREYLRIIDGQALYCVQRRV